MDTEKILTINGVFDQVESTFGYKDISSDEQLMDWLQGIKVRTDFTDITPHALQDAGLDMIRDGKKKTLNAILKALGIDKKDIKDLIME